MDAFTCCEGLFAMYTHSQECKRGRLRRERAFSSALNTFHQFQMEYFQLLGNILNSMQMYILMCTNNVRIRNICLFHVAVMEMSPPKGCKGWACPRGPSAPWVIFWLLRYNEGAVARLLRGRVAALQPWPPPNPGKPILDWLPPHSQL